MEKLIMLGTGNGGTLDLYNTCFIIQNDKGNLLVDTGGGIEIIKRLKIIGVELKDIKNAIEEGKNIENEGYTDSSWDALQNAIKDAEDLANQIGTISYEILCGINKRVPRIYIDTERNK